MKTLKTKILMLVMYSILIAVSIIAFISMYHSYRIINKDTEQIMQLIGDERASEINGYMGTIEQVVDTMYRYAVDHVDDPDSINSIKMMAYGAADSTEGIAAVYLRHAPNHKYYTDGFFLVKRNGVYIDEELTDLSKYLPDDTEHVGWYYLPIRNKAPMWIPPYNNSNIGVYMISYVTPIFKEGKPTAIIGMDVDMNYIYSILSEAKVYDSGYLYITDKHDNIIWKPDGAIDNSKGWKTISIPLKNGLNMLVTAPNNEVYASVGKLFFNIICTLMIVLIAAVIIVPLFAKKMTRVLKNLTEAANKISEGDYNVVIDGTTNDEIGILANTFHDMIQKLKISNDNINKKAYCDELTGLWNRHKFVEYCKEYINNNPRCDVGIIFCDLNRLKYINDNKGHKQGDVYISTFASVFAMCFSGDMCFRLSGDEFVACIVGTTKEDFYEKVDKLKSVNFYENIPVAAIGTVWKECAENIKDILNFAEKDMYKDKQVFYENYPQFKR